MSEFILEIRSDSHGNPVVNGPDYHYVLFSDNPVAVNQMHAGGVLPDNDCAEACSEAVFLRRGIHVAFRDIEAEESVSRAGTYLPNLSSALTRNNVDNAVVQAAPPADANKVMNPAWGGITTDIAPYLAASTGWGVRINDPLPASTTHPTGGTVAVTVEDSDVLVIFKANGDNLFISNLLLYRHLGTPAEVDADDWLAKQVAGGAIERRDGDGPTNNLRAYGLPLDGEAAAAAGDTRTPLIH